jgi:response regulator RpfG family c-di-GMP phosphodiesterase
MLHDVGKVAISDLILKKPARLDINEFEIIKQHTILGARLFSGWESDFDEAAWQVTLTHHERWDGSGYPGHVDYISGKPLPGCELLNGSAKGKKQEEIPIFGRIVAIADVYDALASERAYKEAWDESAIMETIHMDSGKHFDPELVEIFFSQLDIIRSIQRRYDEVQRSSVSW